MQIIDFNVDFAKRMSKFMCQTITTCAECTILTI